MNRIVKDKNIDTKNNEIIINLKKEYEEVKSKCPFALALNTLNHKSVYPV